MGDEFAIGVDQGLLGFDFGDDLALNFKGRQWHRNCFNINKMKIRDGS